MGMWPFASRGSRVDPLDVDVQVDVEAFRHNDVRLTLRLSQRLLDALDVLSVAFDASRPDALRRVLLEVVYGRAAFARLQMAVQQERHARVLQEIRAPDLAHVGKATDDFTLELPRRLKSELESLARLQGQRTGTFVRRLLLRELLGESAYAEWQRERDAALLARGG